MEKITIAIDGMSCGHCVRQVDNALRRLEGVVVENVRVGEAAVMYDPASISTKEIEKAVRDLGYEVTPAGRAA